MLQKGILKDKRLLNCFTFIHENYTSQNYVSYLCKRQILLHYHEEYLRFVSSNVDHSSFIVICYYCSHAFFTRKIRHGSNVFKF